MPASAKFRPAIGHRAILFAALVAVSAAACQAGSVTAPKPIATPPALVVQAAAMSEPAIQVLLGNARAALRSHDQRAYHQFRAQLSARLGAAAVMEADDTYRQVLADVIAADSSHDAHARATYRTALRSLCDTALIGAIEPCDTDLGR